MWINTLSLQCSVSRPKLGGAAIRPKMAEFVKALQNPENEKQIISLFKSLDTDKSGELNFEEWKSLGFVIEFRSD